MLGWFGLDSLSERNPPSALSSVRLLQPSLVILTFSSHFTGWIVVERRIFPAGGGVSCTKHLKIIYSDSRVFGRTNKLRKDSSTFLPVCYLITFLFLLQDLLYVYPALAIHVRRDYRKSHILLFGNVVPLRLSIVHVWLSLKYVLIHLSIPLISLQVLYLHHLPRCPCLASLLFFLFLLLNHSSSVFFPFLLLQDCCSIILLPKRFLHYPGFPLLFPASGFVAVRLASLELSRLGLFASWRMIDSGWPGSRQQAPLREQLKSVQLATRNC